MIVGVLKVGEKRAHSRYMGRRCSLPKSLLPTTQTVEDKIFVELVSELEKKTEKDNRKESWISDASWILIDRKSEARRIGNTELMTQLKTEIRKSLRRDRKARVDSVAAQAETFLNARAINMAYGSIRGWYRDTSGKSPKPTIKEARTTRTEYQKLYTTEKPSEPPLPIHVTPAIISDLEPSEMEIVAALKKLKLGKAAGASGIRVEDLRLWHKNAREPEKDEEPSDEAIEIWEKVMKLIITAFNTTIDTTVNSTFRNPINATQLTAFNATINATVITALSGTFIAALDTTINTTVIEAIISTYNPAII
jgi:hypothetical protein